MPDVRRQQEEATVYKVPKWTTQVGTYLDDFAPDLPSEGKQKHLAHSILIQMDSIKL